MKNKKILSKLIAASILVGGINFAPAVVHFDENNLQIISVAHAEIKTLTAVGRAEFSFGENNPELIEFAKNYARLEGVQAAKKQAGIYLKSFTRTVNGVLTEDDISVVASNTAEIIDVQYKKVPYASVDVKGNATGEIGIAYEATVTVKIDSDELSKYIRRDEKEKSTLIQQNKSSQKNIAEINKNIADLQKNNRATSAEIQKIDNKILAQQKNEEGVKLTYKKDYQGAISKFNEAIQLNQNYAYAYSNLGIVYASLQNYSQAISYFSKSIQLAPNDFRSYIGRGLCYQALGENSKAEADFAKTRALGWKG